MSRGPSAWRPEIPVSALEADIRMNSLGYRQGVDSTHSCIATSNASLWKRNSRRCIRAFLIVPARESGNHHNQFLLCGHTPPFRRFRGSASYDCDRPILQPLVDHVVRLVATRRNGSTIGPPEIPLSLVILTDRVAAFMDQTVVPAAPPIDPIPNRLRIKGTAGGA